MTTKLIAVAGIALLAGACSLRPLGTPSAYSSLPPEGTHATAVAPASPSAVAVARSGFGTVTQAPSPTMPGDLTGPLAEPAGKRVDPVAALNASTVARSRWATLDSRSLSRGPLLESRLIQALAGIGRTDVQTGSVPGAAPLTASAPAKVPARPAKGDAYDRQATMQRLFDGGRHASVKICDGC
ncbi:MAG: hypothetical protein INR70_01970 [Parafilimonas terrae]|nr:hypothetical protein [Parafilimonas terrae]